LSVIFFIYIGTSIKIGSVGFVLPQILLFGVIVMVSKAIILLVIFLFMRFHSKLAFFLSLFLFQIDEDAFILMSLAYANGIFSEEQYLFIVSVVMLSFLLTPFLIGNKEKLYRMVKSFIAPISRFSYVHQAPCGQDLSPIDTLEIRNHVILCGYGRIGSYVGRALMLSNVPFIAIDYNFQTVEKAKGTG
jgi:CPA2 family monovalent cation:H+ antiporter-2